MLKFQAANQECMKFTKRREEEEDNLAEIYNNLTSDMLTENKKCAESNLGLNRIVAANYRGMTDEEIDRVFKGQKDQVHEIQVNDIRNKIGTFVENYRNFFYFN